MDTTTLLALCGIAGILIILAALLLITVLRISIFGLANLLLKAVINPKDEPSRLDNSTISAQSAGNRWRSRDLRQRAQQGADFDQAVARQRGQTAPSIQTTPSPLPPNPAPPSVNLPPDPPRHRRKDDEDDGLLGGFVDGDDDGFLGL